MPRTQRKRRKKEPQRKGKKVWVCWPWSRALFFTRRPICPEAHEPLFPFRARLHCRIASFFLLVLFFLFFSRGVCFSLMLDIPWSIGPPLLSSVASVAKAGSFPPASVLPRTAALAWPAAIQSAAKSTGDKKGDGLVWVLLFSLRKMSINIPHRWGACAPPRRAQEQKKCPKYVHFMRQEKEAT